MRGILFDIQKFMLHDGPGIRTVVFLKGCTLRCKWCCNPESYRENPELAFLSTRCNNCGNCIPICPEKAITLGNSAININFDLCTVCKKCIDVCPTNALKIFGHSYTPGEIIDEVIKDKDFFVNSKGGLTLSGGEALLQLDFATNILKLAKENGLHTCLETAGNVLQRSFSQVMPYVDLFLFDYKLTNSTLHKLWTGANNDQLLVNLEYIYNSGAAIVVRCPIIPGVNDTDEHFNGIVAMSQKYPNLKGIELMPYHEFGKDKFRQLGHNPHILETGSVNNLQKDTWRDRLMKLGCKNLV